MRIVLFFEMERKGNYILRFMLRQMVVMLCLFLICTVLDNLVPMFNESYMKFPKAVEDLLYLKSWNTHLWLNIWQLFTLGYSFYFIFIFMTQIERTLSQEEAYETVVYLKNIGVTPVQVLGGKTIFWVGCAFVVCMVMMFENLLFSLLLHTILGAANIVNYYFVLFFATLSYMAIILFRVAEKGKQGAALDFVLLWLIVPFICAWMPAFVRVIASLFKSSNETVVNRIMVWGDRLEVLTVFSPLKWCFTGCKVEMLYIVCGVICIVVLIIAAFSIYMQRKWYDN